MPFSAERIIIFNCGVVLPRLLMVVVERRVDGRQWMGDRTFWKRINLFLGQATIVGAAGKQPTRGEFNPKRHAGLVLRVASQRESSDRPSGNGLGM